MMEPVVEYACGHGEPLSVVDTEVLELIVAGHPVVWHRLDSAFEELDVVRLIAADYLRERRHG